MFPQVTFRHSDAPSVHELYTLIGSCIVSLSHSLVSLTFFSLFIIALSAFFFLFIFLFLFSFMLMVMIYVRILKRSRESTHTERSRCVQMTLTAEEGYPPINRALQYTLSVVALRYTSRREITPRRWISVIINASHLAPTQPSIREICKSTACISAITFVSKNLETSTFQDK